MAIVDYSSLQDAVASWLRRDDLTANIPDFITLAEAKLNRRLRLRAMEVKTTGASNSNLIALPSGYRSMRSLWVTRGGDTMRLSYRTPEQAAAQQNTGWTSGYTIIGSNIELLPPPGDNTDYMLIYYAAFDALSSGQNWLILNAPDVYLYATLLETAPFLKADARLETWSALLEAAISDLETDDRESRYGGGLSVSIDMPEALR